MKNKSIKKVSQFLVTVTIIYSVLFAILLGVFIFVQRAVFQQNVLNFSDLLISSLVLVVVSVALYFFYQINQISIFVQISVSYLVILIVLYLLGFDLGWYSFNNFKFLILIILINIIGGALIVLALIFKKNFEFKALNKKINVYKGRKKK